MGDLLKTGEVAAMLGVTNTTVIEYANTGRLKVRRLPSGHRRFHRDEVERLLREGQQHTEPAA